MLLKDKILNKINSIFNKKYDLKNVKTLIQKSIDINIENKKYFIQIGAGAGDMDARSNFRDGFTEVIKSISISNNHSIILVEPNPFNIENLNKCWNNYSNIEIFQIGISEKNRSGKQIDFFYTELDAPHYQVASFEAQHVLKHYQHLDKSELKLLKVDSTDLESFIHSVAGAEEIALIALDIEGIDAEIILDTDFSKFNIQFISFEYIHLGEKSNDVHEHLKKCGFYYVGYGVDHNGYDYLYRKI